MQEKKETIKTGVFKDGSGWWHFYCGDPNTWSGNFRSKELAEKGLVTRQASIREQFGEGWEITFVREDL